MTRPRVLVCGDVINDVLVETRAPLVDRQDNPAAIRARPGGSAANQAAWMGRLGLDAVFAGRVGARDAEFHRQELARFGVRALLAADESAATGSIVVLVGPDGERTMIRTAARTRDSSRPAYPPRCPTAPRCCT
jgi:sugar/nucleoside kinase (ribokinase family)